MNHKTHENSVSALLVGAYERDRQLVKDVFRTSGWRLFEARDRGRALRCLSRHPIHVVIAETDVPDWHWKKVLQDLLGLERPPQLIVTSRNADDRLWAEALNVGAYDVLAQPFERAEVERAVESARRHFEVRPVGAERSARVAKAVA
jgi:DNA-binding response OmpR family regulator